jgi:hypothetical protein
MQRRDQLSSRLAVLDARLDLQMNLSPSGSCNEAEAEMNSHRCTPSTLPEGFKLGSKEECKFRVMLKLIVAWCSRQYHRQTRMLSAAS